MYASVKDEQQPSPNTSKPLSAGPGGGRRALRTMSYDQQQAHLDPNNQPTLHGESGKQPKPHQGPDDQQALCGGRGQRADADEDKPLSPAERARLIALHSQKWKQALAIRKRARVKVRRLKQLKGFNTPYEHRPLMKKVLWLAERLVKEPAGAHYADEMLKQKLEELEDQAREVRNEKIKRLTLELPPMWKEAIKLDKECDEIRRLLKKKPKPKVKPPQLAPPPVLVPRPGASGVA